MLPKKINDSYLQKKIKYLETLSQNTITHQVNCEMKQHQHEWKYTEAQSAEYNPTD